MDIYFNFIINNILLNLITNRKLILCIGLVAKRALGQHVFGGSVDSVHSINNIDSIRPPSIMDELLDSMISVDSIVSEMVDPTLGISNYETALSDTEDSLTLRSCQDLSKDETLTPISSDFSSVESTPKKKRNIRSTTPKHRRQSEKERYKTYTIAVDMLLKEQQEMENSLNPRKSLNARQRRHDDRQRFETQIIESTGMSSSDNFQESPISSPPSRNERRREDPERFRTYKIDSFDDDCSIRAMTANFEHFRNNIVTPTINNNAINDIRSKLNLIKRNVQSNDDSLEYEQQTSETESQRDHKQAILNNCEDESLTPKASPSKIQKSPIKKLQNSPGKGLGLSEDALESLENALGSSNQIQQQLMKIQELQMRLQKQTMSPQKSFAFETESSKLKSSYISPYRMTTKVGVTKNKSVRVAKTPTSIIAKVVTRNSSVELKSANTVKSSIKTPNGVKNKYGVIPKVQQKKEKTPEPVVVAPIRQGTFVKDEPTNENVPVVDSSPTKTPQSKLKPPMRLNSAPAPVSKNSSSPKRTSNLPTSITQQLKFRSNSNASMKTKEAVSNTAPVRSNTGIALNNPKKNVTSKIAGIWKKESPLKKNQMTSNSTTQLNNGSGSCSSANSRVSTPTGNVKRIVGTNGTKERIKRSSTCDEFGEF